MQELKLHRGVAIRGGPRSAPRGEGIVLEGLSESSPILNNAWLNHLPWTLRLRHAELNPPGITMARTGIHSDALRALRLMLTGAIALGSVVQAQNAPVDVIVDRSQECARCSITLTRVAHLMPPDTSPDVGPESRIAMDSRRRFYVTSRDARHVLRFSVSGRFEGEVGRPGEGPGEFQRIIDLVIGANDSLLVFERARRMTVFGPDHAYARSAFVPGSAGRAIPRADGSLIVQMNVQSPDRAGHPVHVIRSNGAISRSFGMSGESRASPNCPQCGNRHLNPAHRPDRIWLTPLNRYEIHEWTVDGNLVRTLRVVDSRWFKDWNAASGWVSGAEPRPSSILQVAEDSSGRLRVLGARAVQNWKPMPPPAGSGIRAAAGGIASRNRLAMYDYIFDLWAQTTESVIDVIDPARKRVSASVRIPGQVYLLDASTIARIVRSPDDLYGIEVHRLSVVDPPS